MGFSGKAGSKACWPCRLHRLSYRHSGWMAQADGWRTTKVDNLPPFRPTSRALGAAERGASDAYLEFLARGPFECPGCRTLAQGTAGSSSQFTADGFL